MSRNKTCEVCKVTRANYGKEVPSHCAKCKTTDMIYLTFKKCIICKEKEAKYNYEGSKKEYCIDCKKDEMIFSERKMCIECKTVYATFGVEKGKQTHCSKCKKEGMINVKNRLCIECKTNLCLYGFETDKKPSYCKNCKKDGMIDILSKKCEVCKKVRASFGIPGKKETHCSNCKEEGMVDVRSKKCIECKENTARYNVFGKQREYCILCKKDDMVRCDSSICILCNTKRASFNIEGKEAEYCNTCKKDEMINVRSEKCMAESCTNQANYKYNKYCTWCFQHLFPEDPKAKTIYKKSLESEVAVAILEKDSSFKHDKAMFIGGCDCSIRRRIDFWKIIGNTILAIEVDEKQHKQYNKKDEEIRYDDLYMAFSGKWIFIRFNPDSFRDKKGKLIRMKLKDKLPTLLHEIHKQTERIQSEENKDLVEIHNLFFDEK